MAYNIEDIVNVINPLRSDSNKLSSNVYYENEEFFKLSLKRSDDKIVVTFLFDEKIKLLTPSQGILKNNFYTNYFNIPIYQNTTEDFRNIIIHYRKKYLVIDIEYINVFFIKNLINENKVSFGFDDTNETGIKVQLYTDISDFYKLTNKKIDILPIYFSGIGLNADINKNNNLKLNFSEIKSLIERDNLFIIIENWEKYYKNKRSLIDGLINKLKLNKIKTYFKYDNMIDENIKNNVNILKLRNGKPVSQDNKNFIDYFSNSGQKDLLDIYKNLFNAGVDGLYLNPVIPKINNIEVYDKIVARYQNKVIPYFNNVQLGSSILSKLIEDKFIKEKDKKNMFFTNFVSPFLKSTIFIKEFSDDLKESILFIENYYRQGFSRFAFLINKKSYKNIILIILVKVIIFDVDFLIDLLSNEKSSQTLKHLFRMREKIAYVIDNSENNFIKKGKLPFKTYLNKGKLKGVMIGNDFYCAIVDNGMINRKIMLPEGLWFNFKYNLLKKGDSDFSCKGISDQILFFQKINSVHIINNNFYGNRINKHVSFYFFININELKNKVFKTELLERTIINDNAINVLHSFKVEYKKNILLNYISDNDDNINRRLFFIIYLDGYNIDKIFCNKKRIIYKQKNKTKYIEFDILNKSNKLEIEIFMLK